MASIKTSNQVDREIGARVRMWRTQRGLSQERLGNALGLTFQQVQKYEKGTNRIGGSRLTQIAAAELAGDGAAEVEGQLGDVVAGAVESQGFDVEDICARFGDEDGPEGHGMGARERHNRCRCSGAKVFHFVS